MPVKKEAWPPGTPAWVDLTAADFDATKAFYAGLFGWEYDQSGEEYGRYATATMNGESVAGIAPAQGPDAPPPNWLTYLATADAAATVTAAAEAGATVVMPAMEVGPMGSMAVLADPTGAVFGLWQAGQHTGFNRYNEPGSDVWNEAMVADYDLGKGFYTTVFGFTTNDISDAGFSYAMLEVDGNVVGGIGGLGGQPGPAHWNTYFEVVDAAVACERAAELGAVVVSAPAAGPYGTSATLRAPGGEVFMIIQPPTGEATG